MAVGTLVAAAAVLISGQATGAVQPAATPTVAPVADLRCGAPGTNSFGLVPPLTLTVQSTTIERATAYRSCSAPAFPGIREGYEHRTNILNDSCVIMLQAAGTSTFNIIWNTSQTSTLTVQRSAQISGNQFIVTFTGNVTAGLFAGRKARQVFTANATELIACLAGNGQVPFLISDVTLVIHP